MRLRISDAFLVRVAALPIDSLDSLHSGETTALWSRWRLEKASLQNAAELLSDALHDVISCATDRSTRNALIEIRRDVHNLRHPKELVLQRAASNCVSELRSALDSFFARCRALDALEAEAHRSYDRSVIEGKRHVRQLASDERFLRGLQLSSETLFANRGRYIDNAAARGSRADRVERGLLRYLMRTAAKATPFGSLCVIAEGRFRDDCTRPVYRPLDDAVTRGKPYARLNKSIYNVLWSALRTNPAVRDRTKVATNDTAAFDTTSVRFLATVGGTESFRTVRRSPAFDTIWTIAHGLGQPTFGDLVSAICASDAVSTDAAEACEYVQRLIDVGALSLATPVEEQDADWVVAMLRELRTITDDTSVIQVADVLQSLVDAHSDFSNGGIVDRERCLSAAKAAVRNLAVQTGKAFAGAENNPIYEDVATDAVFEVNRTAELQLALAEFGSFVAITAPLAWPDSDQSAMHAFFQRQYSGEACGVPLLQFYEDYYRDRFAQQAAMVSAGGARAAAQNPGTRAAEQAPPHIRAGYQRLTDCVAAAWAEDPDAEAITISLDALREAVGATRSIRADTSISAFVSIVESSDPNVGPQLVVPTGRYHPGYGKYFSRFLHMLPGLAGEVLRENSAHRGTLLSEITGDEGFNANLHPAMLPRQLTYPGKGVAHNGDHLDWRDLVVMADADTPGELTLKRRHDGRTVRPIDLGFLNPRLRPPLFRLLAAFTSGRSFAITLPDVMKNADPVSVEQVRRRPRCIVGRHLVIGRQSWIVPSKHMPRPHAGELDSAYFGRLAQWREQHGIPEQVYARVVPVRPSGSASRTTRADATVESNTALDEPTTPREATAAARGSGQPRNERQPNDLHKPAYIDFSAPLMVRVFASLAGRLDTFKLYLDECLPSRSHLARQRSTGQQFATELVLQWHAAPDSALTR
jgi:hypothetical protein